MRVSTTQFYLQSALQMSNQNADINERMSNLSSGKRILTAKDDAVNYGTLVGYNESLANIDKYQRNITQAQNHNNLQEVVFAEAENLLNNIKDQLLQANSGAMSDEDLVAIAKQTRNNLEQVFDLANSQNEHGDYIFAGYQTNQPPFSQTTDGSVVYAGDDGVRATQVAKNIDIVTSQSGDAAFMQVKNPIGDFVGSYSYASNDSAVVLASANITDRGAYNTSDAPHTLNIDSVTSNLSVSDNSGAVVFPVTPALPVPYVAGQTITFDGIEVTLSGNPLPGDSITLTQQTTESIFTTLNNAVTWLEQGTNPPSQSQRQAQYNQILDQLNTGLNHITSRRVDAGVRLQTLDGLASRHLDAELNITQGKSTLEDLDFAKAISEFEQSKIALQASQQAFSKVQGLTLFNYI
jgi:flagellar hook-associated protein 3 FlgL